MARRLRVEPGVAEVDDTVESPAKKLVFVTDQEKAALNGVSVDEIARTLRLVLAGGEAGTVRLASERNPLRVELRLPRAIRSSPHDLAAIRVKGMTGQFTPLSELGRWETTRVDQTIYHKNLERVVYVTAETLGRTPAECVLDVEFRPSSRWLPAPAGSTADVSNGGGWVSERQPRPLAERTFVAQRRWYGLVASRGNSRHVQRRGGMEDHPRCFPRPRPGLRCGDGHDLCHPGHANRLLPRADWS